MKAIFGKMRMDLILNPFIIQKAFLILIYPLLLILIGMFVLILVHPIQKP